jgi:hypothetical protein
MSIVSDIRDVAEEVREKCLDFALSDDSIGYDFHGQENLEMMCAVASATLFRELCRRGIGKNLRVVEGEYWQKEHCWVEVSGYIVDITASQYRGPRIVIEPIEAVRDGEYRGNDKNRLRDWPKEQRPNAKIVRKILSRHR